MANIHVTDDVAVHCYVLPNHEPATSSETQPSLVILRLPVWSGEYYFHSENGGDVFLRKVGKHLHDIGRPQYECSINWTYAIVRTDGHVR